ncbi:MAG: dimethylargininase [Gemmatimonadetes bacterium]|nr:dimethylargininase [Gemmatimonadota bacterium]
MIVALTREVSASIAECELTHVARTPIHLGVAREQHEAYIAALESLDVRVVRLAELPAHPDAVFVEDTAVVLDEVAVLTRPGAASRRAEVDAMEDAVAPFRRSVRMTGPATLDGGDVLRLGRTLFVGRTPRTSSDGIADLRALVEPYGYEVRDVAVSGALHLKTAVTQVGPDWILVNPDWVDAAEFDGFDALRVDPDEPFAANAVLVNDALIHSTAYPRTQAMLRAHGLRVVGVDASELAKAEGGVTCCSLLFDVVN